jgi:thiol-disulfide isomerase/thioredoxin
MPPRKGEARKRDDIAFLFNTFGFTLVLVAMLVVFQPYLEADYRIEEVKAVERQVIEIDPEGVVKLIREKKKPVMLVAYASWCGFCRRLMPVATGLVREGRLEGIEPFFVSLDTEPRRFSKYLVHNDYHTVFFPYVVDHGLTRQISSAMKATGSRFDGAIPYTGFFDRHGRVVQEAVGMLSEDRLLFMAKQAKATD